MPVFNTYPKEEETMSRNGLVKITLDGLLLFSFKNSCPEKLCQVGILVTNFDGGKKHELKIKVNGHGGQWDYPPYSHDDVLKMAPFWLYVGTENSKIPDDHTAMPYKMNDLSDCESFLHVLNMEDLPETSPIKIKPCNAPSLNIPQGVFRSADLKVAEYRKLGSKDVYQKKGKVATKIIAEIDYKDIVDKPRLILRSAKKNDPLFQIPLEADAQYKVSVKNAPTKESSSPHKINHFPYYYCAFEEPQENKYEVEIPDQGPGPIFEDAPPCISVRLKDGSLPD
jgi:hypothetical protein